MNDVHELLFVAAGGLIVLGLVLSLCARPVADFHRTQVSRVLPRRYWAFASDPIAVRTFGVLAALVGVALFIGVFVAVGIR